MWAKPEKSGKVVLAHAEMSVQSLLDGVVTGKKVCQPGSPTQVSRVTGHTAEIKSDVF